MDVKSVCDQLGEVITFPWPPRRVISLVPSQTELLADLGLEKEVIGITRFCVHPEGWRKEKTIIGGTKNFRFDVIDNLKPDLIIGNKEENDQGSILKLKEKYPVWMSDIVTIKECLEMISAVGEVTGRVFQSTDIVKRINDSFSKIKPRKPFSVLYLIWRKPWMAVGSDTFIHTLLAAIGLSNCLAGTDRYPELSEDQIRTLSPDLIFLSSEPYPFKTKHVDEVRQLCPSSRIMLVDGEMFSWYGSRLMKAPAYFNSLDI